MTPFVLESDRKNKHFFQKNGAKRFCLGFFPTFAKTKWNNQNQSNMRTKSLQMKRALRTALLVLLLGVVGMGKGYAQQDVTRDVIIGDLMYRLNSSSKTAIVLGHKDGTSATGELVIPHSVGHYGNSYSVTGIAENAFRGCSGLTGNLNLSGLKSIIGNGAFEGCSGFTGNLVIPPVVAVGNRAFSGCSGFSSVSLPSYLHSGELNFDIGEYAFFNCTGLDSISFPYVGRFHISIGNHAFSGCNGLSTLNFPDYNNFQIIIGDYAFSECNGLSSSICFTYLCTSNWKQCVFLLYWNYRNKFYKYTINNTWE